MDDSNRDDSRLARRLGLADATFIGLGSMLGAGVFVAFAPAAEAAGNGLLLGVVIAGLVAYANANSSAQLAARYPSSGGTYVYGRERLGPYWGFIAGWVFIVGKIASCSAGALTFGYYVWPGHPHVAACIAAGVLTAVNYVGIHRTAQVTRTMAGIVLVVLATAMVAAARSGGVDTSRLDPSGGFELHGVLQSAAILFFAFAGYARIATLSEEVRDPARTIPRAVLTALAITVVVYLVVGAVLLSVLGVDGLAGSVVPVLEAATDDPSSGLGLLVRAGAGLAGLSVLLALLAGVSRTVFAMAATRDLPNWFAAVHPTHRVPHRAELVVGGLVIALAATASITSAITFSACTILLYYAIANASALSLGPAAGRSTRYIAALGGIGCVGLAVLLPGSAVMFALAAVAVGTCVYAISQYVWSGPRRAGR